MAEVPYRVPPSFLSTPDEQRAREALTRDLVGGETLLWAGQPKQGLTFGVADLILVPFSLAWAAFAFFWEGMVLTHAGPPMFALFGLPLVAVGLYVTVGRFVVDARKRARTFYGITEQRVLIVTHGFTRQLTSIDLSNHSEIGLDERADGSGTITFGKRGPMAFFEDTSWPTGRKMAPAFVRIPNARAILNLMRSTKSATREP